MKLRLQTLALSGIATVVSAIALAAPARAEAPNTDNSEPTPIRVAQAGDLVDVLVASGDFDTLVQLVQLAGLADTLAGDGPFTVFAPSDAAFAALDPAVVDALTDPANRDVLADVLKFHVLPEVVTSNDIGNETLGTLYGPVNARVQGNRVTVGPANVTEADIPATNGVAHKIDTVLVPSDTVSRLTTPVPTPRVFPVTW